MKRIALLTQYYPPETGAPQNRLHSLARFLQSRGFSVEVVTALPNYPKNKIFEGYRAKFSVKEDIDGISVHRCWIFVTGRTGIVVRLLNYFSFTITSLFKLLQLPRTDWILCESPPLFLGMTAVVAARIKGSKLIFNVSDLWPESAEKLGIVTNKFLLRAAYKLEAWIYRNAYLVSGQTKGIVRSISSRFPEKKVVWVPNGIDQNFLHAEHQHRDWRMELGFSPADFVLLYAGIIGHAQGLEVLLNASARLSDASIKFLIVGDGPEKHRLEQLVNERGLRNVHFVPNLERKWIPSLIQACDAYIVPLRKLDLFKGAIPSKLFEPLALSKPILLGVDGEARELFIEEGKCGLYFEPENDADLARKIITLRNNPDLTERLGVQGRAYITENFDRAGIYERFLESFR